MVYNGRYYTTKEVIFLLNVPYDNVKDFMEWTNTKSELKFNPPKKSFPILPNCVYWAYMGCNIGSEEGKHRPILVTRTYKKSPICTVIPLTSQRLNDGYWYHIDLEKHNSTALCEQMRIIDLTRIQTPFRIGGKIMSISKNDWEKINKQILWLYKLKNQPEF